MRRSGLSGLTLPLLPLVLLLVGGCAGKLPPRSDGSSPTEAAPTADWPRADTRRDRWPAPADGYHTAPFGCLIDGDCFGQRCCATPWGVRLCAPSCSL